MSLNKIRESAASRSEKSQRLTSYSLDDKQVVPDSQPSVQPITPDTTIRTKSTTKSKKKKRTLKKRFAITTRVELRYMSDFVHRIRDHYLYFLLSYRVALARDAQDWQSSEPANIYLTGRSLQTVSSPYGMIAVSV